MPSSVISNVVMSYPKQPFYSASQQPLGSVVRSPLLQAIDQNNVAACEELIQSNEEQVHERVRKKIVKICM